MDWAQAKDLLLISMASGISVYVGKQMRDLAKSVNKLTIQVTLLFADEKVQKVTLKEHSMRLTKLEARKINP